MRPVRLALVADTHLPRFGTRLPAALRSGIRDSGAELILHLGDLTTRLAVDLLEEIAPVEVVAGNNDPPDLAERYGRRKVIEVAGVRIGMVHGDGKGGSTAERAVRAFVDDEVDVVAFGHSHIPSCVRRGRVWVVNPGSPTDKRRNALFSYATLEVRGGLATPALHFYADRSPDG